MGSSAAAAAAAAAAADSAQWLSVKEETIFLHDGLIRVTDLAELPSEILGAPEAADTDLEILTFETKNPTELAERLRSVCGNQSNAYARLLEYRLNALRGLWNAQRQLALEEQHERESSGDEETLALLKRQGLLQQPEQAPFTSRMGLLLVFPLIQSQSRTDPSLCNITAEVLLNCLRDCQPLSLTKEPADCLNGIETLLCSWLEDPADTGRHIPHKQKENAAAALVALACARGSLKTFVHTVHLLQKQTDLGSLPVADVLYRLLLLEGGPGSPSCLLGGKHIVSWGYEDMLPAPDSNTGSSSENKDADLGRCLTADGLYLYTTNSVGRGVSKLGSGLHGTLRGFVYCRNEELEPGWVAFGSGNLLHRPVSFDNKPHSLFQVIDQNTLQVCQMVPMPANHLPVGSTMSTVHLSSDGTYFYWIWSPASLNEKTPKGHSVFMDIFELVVENGVFVANPLQERTILMRKEGESAKSINEMLLSRLSRYRASPSATLAALTGSTISNALKEDQAANTSCGLPLKMLRKTPIYTCGTYLVMLVPPPGGSGSSATRSLFGGTSGLSSLKILASSLVYNISDGQFTSRADLIDAAGSSLGRGALVPGLGACYDTVNNMLWTCSNDYIDQWCNPGNQAFHYVCQRLGVSHIITEPKEEAITTNEVINQLLHHVGAMCIHQLNLLATNPNLPITSVLGKQHPIEAHHLSSICDIMEKAMVNGDTCIIRCILVVFQVVFKFFFSPQTERNRDIIRRSGLLLWQLLMAPKDQICPEIQKEVCLAISSGLNILYPGETEINNLLKLVLTEGERNSGLSQLRDVILTNLAEQLQNNRFGSEEDEHYRLNDELLHYILKIVVRESCILITKCQTVSKEDFQKLLSTVPAASSCLRYLMAVQNHLLSNTILIKPDENDDSDNSLQGETLKVQELKVSILALATQILTGCDEVLEMLQQVTTALINSDLADREQRLKGLEQVTKATMLGHLLPVLLTSLMHPNLQTLTMADALMPQLVQLVLYTSQTALLLKTQCPVFAEVGCSPCGASDQKGRLFPDERMLEEKEEPGFLTGLKIPAPWAAGKTVETVHPVRDNYKFKETVHIPGARCLYLRFDSRCSSQYDYDKLVIYAGPNTNSRKVAEYGGNTLGYGSRSVLGTGWPKDLVKVEGDTVTFSFEMRSGREHNTPDKAMWGFACTVRAQESSEDVSGGLPFLVDLALGLSVLACSMLRILYNGPEITKEEEACQELLRSKLLQRCQWQVEANGVISPALTPSPSPLPLTIEEDREFTYPCDVLVPPVGNYFDLPRIRLPPGIMIKLREISGRARPQFRPSIKEVIQPDVMEEMVVSCVIKHLNLVDALQSLINFQYQEEHAEEYDLLCKIMGETFKKLNAMERQLQSVAELEQKWQSEVDDAMQGKLENNMPFFYDYHFNENKMKELELLCSMREVSFDGNDLENMVLSLREKFLQEVNSVIQKPSHPLAKTKTLVKSLMNRAELLLHVTISAQPGLTRSISGTPAETPACKSASETKVISHAVRQPVFLRSMSAPSDLEMIGNEDLEFTRANQRRRHVTSHRSSSFTLLQSLAIEDSRDKPTYSVLLGQLFAFIGTNPDQAVSSSSFLLAAQTRWRRGNTRKQALVHMRELLTAAVRVGGVTHLVGPVTMVLQGGPRIEELTCGGMVEQVQEAFGETMTSVVSLCARYPIACANSIGLLCTIPYTRSEEKCLVRSGLVQLMDRLCSLSSQTESSSSEKQTKKQKVATMAWAAFQVLANRCVEWEKEEGGSTEAVHSGLARQVSSLLTNHLARATECCGNQAAGNDALQDVLSLLNDLSRSHIGKAILSQPACVSKLLSLLLDQRPSPKLVLIILQLCRAALPLMSVEDCGNVELPPWSYSVPSLNSEQEDPSDPASKIASLLLAKLADYVVPGCQTVLSPTASEPDTTLTKTSPKNSLKGDKDPGEESEAVDGKLSIFIHKREDQSSHEVLQPLLSSSEGRPFRLGTGANMEKVVKMDRDMTKGGCCEVITEEAAAALRKATKWAQSGLIVSVGPPVESVSPETVSGLSTGDKKKTAQTSICRERNSELARTDPVRPFISGHVANSMAAEVIALLHSLLMAPESNAAQIWTTTAEKVLSRALMYIPQLGKYAESILENGSSSGRKLAKLQRIARQAVAALCALGGFKETIKIGSEVQVLGRGISGSIGVVASINEQEGIATVRFPPIDCRKTSQASDTLTIPLSRLCVPRSEALPLHKLSITEKVVQAVQSMLLPQEGSLSIHTSLPATGDGSAPVMAVVRLLAEIRTRACLVMAQLLEDSLFCEEFIQQCPAAVEVLNLVAQECSAGERLAVVEGQCERLRMLYRDCARPPPPPLQADRRQPKEITWSPSRVFPPVRACMFSSHLTSVTFLADPSAGGGLPRGTFIYATSPLPVQAPSFYWEIEIVSYGDTDDDTGPIVSFGFATEAEKRDGAWTNPVGTCLFHNNGRAVHYNGSSLLQWKSVRLDVTLSPGDVAGIGWERTEGTPPPPGQPAKGRVYFTYCGQRLSPYLEDVSGGMWPVVHIQKKAGNFLWTTDMAACVKELVFHLLAELLRTVHSLEQRKHPVGLSSSIALQLNPCLAMLMALQSELHKLYDEETQSWVSGSACGGSGVAAATDQGRFSTYFHALMEGCLAVAEVTLPTNMSVTASGVTSTTAPNLSDSSSSSSSSPGQTPQSPSLLSKRKKVKMKREKASSSGKRQSSRSVESDPAMLSIGGSKPEDMLWFHRALTLLIILRHLTRKDPQGLGVTSDAIADACQALVGPTAHSRLLVISGIPTHLDEGIVRGAIRKACNAHGGVFKDEIYIPLQDEDPKKPKDKAEGGDGKAEPEKTLGFPSADSLEVSTSSSLTPAMSISASASTSQASICSSQGISQTASDLSVDPLPSGLEPPVPSGVLEPHVVSSQESLDISLCSTGSLGSLGSLGEPLDNAETASVSDVGSMYTVTSLDNQPLAARPIKGFAVVEIRSRAKIEKIRASLFNNNDLIGLSSLDGEDELMEMSTEEILTVSVVNQSLFDTQGSPGLEDYFNDKSIKGEKLVPGAREVLTEIFKSCAHSEQMLSLTPAKPIKVSDIYLSKEQINSQTPGNLLHLFFTNVRPPKKVLEDQLTQILRKYGVPKPKFDKSKYNKGGKEQHPVKVVSTKRPITKPPAKDKAVLNSVRWASEGLNVPIESLRLRFALLQSLNTTLETFFLPLVELRPTPVYAHSIAALLKEAKGLIFYDTKVTVMNRVLNATVQRTADHAAPEITLDPLEIVGGEIRASENSYFCQAARQLASVSSSQLCVKLASGGDPTYAFNIRFTGEEVHGTSGSFRHFLWQVCKELQSSSLSLLLLCPSSAVNKNKGKYILTPSPITCGEEQLLHFLGQLLGIAIRADVPLPLDLLPSFWKTLVGEPLDPDQDLQEADILTYNYVKKFESINDETELEALCAEIASQHLAPESPEGPNKPCCRFTYLTMTGEEVELCSRGRHIPVAWENKDIYAAAIRSLRLRELQNAECVTAVRAGLGAIIPLQLLTTLSPLEMELRTCGLPYINLEFLKAHTMYQVGLMETDQHIEFFWGALEMFAQEELCKFIKFACNQERIPFTCPCKDGGPDTAHVPPYPMKIAPPDGTAGSPDSRYIRVETCMFMIKLPQYSSLEIMLEKLRCAIHYREDPLSG
ncbi:probable E3 ubiquitin-protein ligase HECTD4 [Leptonychotes weddellii]|uniref:Probable E3 ubiquitin-protein ligase HECTD4 n=1 Tax=Leptonychotes weddellii TaxID=9713 RepID=A0A7F8R1I7_LEPWE|nr:probable E3 ubiquitin-protein ligase HECTD4 [Leptonychotes weddellii]